MTGGRDRAGPPWPTIRRARPEEFAWLRALEQRADALFAEVGMAPFAPDDQENHLPTAAVVLVAGDPAVGFACVDVVDGVAHLWQLSVDPPAMRHGTGTALVSAVCSWAAAQGFSAITLTTFRDVAWNAPFYRRLGFEVIDALTPGLLAIRSHERAVGEDDLGPRVAMRRDLEPQAAPPR